MAAAAEGPGTGKAIQLVNNGTAANITGGQAYNVVLGTYEQLYQNKKSGDWVEGDNIPITWRVLSNADKKLFLLSSRSLDQVLYNETFYNIGAGINLTWETSTIRSWLNGYGATANNDGKDYSQSNFLDTAFSDGEKALISNTTVINSTYDGTPGTYANPTYNTSGGNDTTDRIFLLSIAEVNNSTYFPENDMSRLSYANEKHYLPGPASWWLRSPGDQSEYFQFACVATAGDVSDIGTYTSATFVQTRPALYLDMSSVVLTSVADGGKSSGTVGPEALKAVSDVGTDTGETSTVNPDVAILTWKLTVLDSDRSFDASTNSSTSNAAGYSDWTVDVTYSGALTGDNEFISAMIADSSGTILYYGRVAQGNTAGTAGIKIPTGLTAGSYSLKVFSEQYNGDRMTDYASNFIDIPLTVTADTTAPVLSAGEVERTGVTDATVKFTSSEGGTYYYEVVEQGATAPTIDTTGTGTPCDTTEQTISLSSLLGTGAKDIYIVVKDAAGNGSVLSFKITIPAYVAPVYQIEVSPASLDFGSVVEGYAAQTVKTVMVKNTGNQVVTLVQPTATDYEIGVLSATSIDVGETATFTVRPQTGRIAGNYDETITVSGDNNVSASVTASFTVNAPTSVSHSITVQDDGNGTASASVTSATAGTEVTLSTTPSTGYHFKEWEVVSGGVAIIDNKFTMPDEAVIIKAIFEEDASVRYIITATAGANGSISPDSAQVAAGGSQTFTIMPEEGYVIDTVTVDGRDVTDQVSGDQYTFTDVQQAHTIHVTFKSVSQPVIGYSIIFEPNGGTGTAEYISGISGSYTLPTDADLGFNAPANKRFKAWAEGSIEGPHYAAGSSYTVSADTTFYAIWEDVSTLPTPQQYTISLGASPIEGGTVTGGGTYESNTSATVTATANEGYTFVKWTENDNEVSTSASYTFTVTVDRSLVAVFEADSDNGTGGGGSDDGTGDGGSGGGSGEEQHHCTHEYEWAVIQEGTLTQDGIMAMKCKWCGDVDQNTLQRLSAYYIFNKLSEEAIREATGTELTIETNLWESFHKDTLAALAEKPELSLTINYTHKHRRYTVTIPAGADVMSLLNEGGFCGFRYMDSIYGGKEIKKGTEGTAEQ